MKVLLVEDNPHDAFLLRRQARAEPSLARASIEQVDTLAAALTSLRSEGFDVVLLGLDLGAVDYVAKPVRPAALRARVQTHLALCAAQERLTQQNDQLEQMVSARTRELRATYERLGEASLETVNRLARAAEFRDDTTGAHVQRMSHFAAAIARHLGYDEAACEESRQAAPMHDVGKIGVPDQILLKEGPLDEAEWEIMKGHALIGARILEGSPLQIIQLGETIARTHHERWDGTDYPRGLAGDAIPEIGRIVAIADVFDALTSRRPYKAPYSFDEAWAIILAAEGAHFDPKVVQAMRDILPEIREIQRRFEDP